MLTNSERGIVVVQVGARDYLIDNGTTTTTFTENYQVREYKGGSSISGERVFFADITGDGVEELIIRESAAENNLGISQYRIFDVNTLEEISRPLDIMEQMNILIQNHTFIDKCEKGATYYHVTDSSEKEYDDYIIGDNIELITDSQFHYYEYLIEGEVRIDSNIVFRDNDNGSIFLTDYYAAGTMEYSSADKQVALSPFFEIIEENSFDTSRIIVNHERYEEAESKWEEYRETYGKEY